MSCLALYSIDAPFEVLVEKARYLPSAGWVHSAPLL